MEWLSLVASGLALILAGSNAAIWMIVKMNDFAHFERNLEEIKKVVNSIDKKQDRHDAKIAAMEARCDERHK